MSFIPIVTTEELKTYRDTPLLDTASLVEQAIYSFGNFDVDACDDPPKEPKTTHVSIGKARRGEGTGEGNSREEYSLEEASLDGAAREESCHEVEKKRAFIPKIPLSLPPKNHIANEGESLYPMYFGSFYRCALSGTII